MSGKLDLAYKIYQVINEFRDVDDYDLEVIAKLCHKYDGKIPETSFILDVLSIFENIPAYTEAKKDPVKSISDYLIELARIKKTQKNESRVQNFLSYTSMNNLRRELNPRLEFKRSYVVLDSKYAEFLGDNTRMRWYVSNTKTSLVDGTIVTDTPIRNIVSIRLYGTVFATWLDRYTMTGSIIMGRVLFDEFQNQAYMDPIGRRYHFLFELQDYKPTIIYNDAVANSRSKYNEDFRLFGKRLMVSRNHRDNEFKFHTPIQSINSLTMSISYPSSNSVNEPFVHDLMEFPRYKISGATWTDTSGNIVKSFLSGGLVYITIPVDLVIQTTNQDQTPDIYSIQVRDFTTSDETSDAHAIAWLNNITITGITSYDSRLLTINYHTIKPIGYDTDYTLTTVGSANELPSSFTGTPQPFTLYMVGKRNIFEMEITHM